MFLRTFESFCTKISPFFHFLYDVKKKISEKNELRIVKVEISRFKINSNRLEYNFFLFHEIFEIHKKNSHSHRVSEYFCGAILCFKSCLEICKYMTIICLLLKIQQKFVKNKVDQLGFSAKHRETREWQTFSMTKVFKYFREPLHAKDEERREELQGNVRPNEVSFSEEGMIKYILSDCRGCLTEPASELDLAWSGYVETVERLVVAVDGRMDPLRLNAERAVRQLDTRISDAIMHAMENGPALEEKVSTRRKNSSTRVIFVRRTG